MWIDLNDKSYYAFDFDGTLYNIETNKPIISMIKLIKKLLRQGKNVKIFTARVCSLSSSKEFVEEQRRFIQNWCLEYIGQVLEITSEKDFHMICYYDDRAVQVYPNKGITLEWHIKHLENIIRRLKGLKNE